MLNSFSKPKFLSLFSNNRNIILIANIFWYGNFGFINTFIGIYYFSLSDGNFILTGLLIGIPALSLVVSSFIFGNLADLIGEKKVIIFAFGALVMSDFAYFIIKDSATFFIAYILFNFLLASFGPSINRLASRSVSKGDIFGIMGAYGSFGYFVGTMVGGFLYDQLEMSTIFLSAFISAILGLLTVINIKNSNTPHTENNTDLNTDKKANNGFSIESLRLIATKNVIAIFMIGFILYIGVNISGPFFSVYLIDELAVPGWQWGLMNGIATILGMFSAWAIGKYLHANFRIPTLLSVIGYFLVYLIFWLTNDIILLFLVYAIPAYAGLMVAAPALIAASVPENVRGTAMGLLIAFQNLGLGFGAILGGIIGNYYNSALNNFLVSALISIIPMIITIIFLKNHTESQILSRK